MNSKEWVESKGLSIIELEMKLVSMQDEIFKLKFRHSVSPIKNPLIIRVMRKDIARLKTLVAQKKVEENKK